MDWSDAGDALNASVAITGAAVATLAAIIDLTAGERLRRRAKMHVDIMNGLSPGSAEYQWMHELVVYDTGLLHSQVFPHSYEVFVRARARSKLVLWIWPVLIYVSWFLGLWWGVASLPFVLSALVTAAVMAWYFLVLLPERFRSHREFLREIHSPDDVPDESYEPDDGDRLRVEDPTPPTGLTSEPSVDVDPLDEKRDQTAPPVV